MARVSTVDKARKAQGQCGRCGKEIGVGDGYRHASPGFRGPKLIRCLGPSCYFRQSELTTSKLAQVYAAQESADEALDALGDDWTETDDVQSILEDVASEVRTVAEEYAEAADAMGDAGEENQERADELEGFADTLEGVNFDDPPSWSAGEEPSDEDVAEAWAEWREGVIDAAREEINNCPL